MALAQRTGLRDIGRRRALRAGVRVPTALMAGSMLALGRLILGGEGGLRSYPHERFSDFELHQIVAGRKDRLDGLK